MLFLHLFEIWGDLDFRPPCAQGSGHPFHGYRVSNSTSCSAYGSYFSTVSRFSIRSRTDLAPLVRNRPAALLATNGFGLPIPPPTTSCLLVKPRNPLGLLCCSGAD